MDNEVSAGDIVRMRKPHACGNDVFHVTRVGCDVKIRCDKCKALIMLDRAAFIRFRKTTISGGAGEPPNGNIETSKYKWE